VYSTISRVFIKKTFGQGRGEEGGRTVSIARLFLAFKPFGYDKIICRGD